MRAVCCSWGSVSPMLRADVSKLWRGYVRIRVGPVVRLPHSHALADMEERPTKNKCPGGTGAVWLGAPAAPWLHRKKLDIYVYIHILAVMIYLSQQDCMMQLKSLTSKIV